MFLLCSYIPCMKKGSRYRLKRDAAPFRRLNHLRYYVHVFLEMMLNAFMETRLPTRSKATMQKRARANAPMRFSVYVPFPRSFSSSRYLSRQSDAIQVSLLLHYLLLTLVYSRIYNSCTIVY